MKRVILYNVAVVWVLTFIWQTVAHADEMYYFECKNPNYQVTYLYITPTEGGSSVGVANFAVTHHLKNWKKRIDYGSHQFDNFWVGGNRSTAMALACTRFG